MFARGRQTVACQNPSTATASPSPGHGGIVSGLIPANDVEEVGYGKILIILAECEISGAARLLPPSGSRFKTPEKVVLHMDQFDESGPMVLG